MTGKIHPILFALAFAFFAAVVVVGVVTATDVSGDIESVRVQSAQRSAEASDRGIDPFRSNGPYSVTLFAPLVWYNPRREPGWETLVSVNAVLRDSSPVTVTSGDSVEIVDRVWVTYTDRVTLTLGATWTNSLELTAWDVPVGDFKISGRTSTWNVADVVSNTWHSITKTFQITDAGRLADAITETLWVEDALPQPTPKVLEFVQTSTQNLLLNPGFEGLTCDSKSAPGWCVGNWTRDTFNGETWTEIYTPQGWVTFWSEGANPSDPGGWYGRPECKVIPNVAPFIGPPARIRSGQYAVQQFGKYRAFDSGVYQVVGDLEPHATVRAAAHAHAWSCNDGGPLSCGDPWNTLFRVGIDPDGGTDPWSPNVIWVSAYSYDLYRLIGPVETKVGDAGVVTVFLRATAKWPFENNDVYWDDASLVALSD